MNKIRIVCLSLIFTLLLPYICFAQDDTSEEPTLPEFNGAAEWTISELTQSYEYGLTTARTCQDMSGFITREEFCELAVLFYEKYTTKEAELPQKNPFSDTDNPNIKKAVGLAITNGVAPGTFNPDGFISKQDMALMIVRAMKSCGIDTSVTTQVDKFTDYYKIGSHAQSAVEVLQERGILKGVSSGSQNGVARYKLEPQGSIPKQEAIILLKRSFEYAVMVRNASKWGPEVYIPKLEVGDGFILSDEKLLYENDIFDLEIAPGTPVDVDFEQRMYDIFKYVQKVTGIENTTGRKYLIALDLDNSYNNYLNNCYNCAKYCGLLFYNNSELFAPDNIYKALR